MPGCANEGTVAPAVDRAESIGLMMGLPAARLGSMRQLSGGWQTRCRVAHDEVVEMRDARAAPRVHRDGKCNHYKGPA